MRKCTSNNNKLTCSLGYICKGSCQYPYNHSFHDESDDGDDNDDDVNEKSRKFIYVTDFLLS